MLSHIRVIDSSDSPLLPHPMTMLAAKHFGSMYFKMYQKHSNPWPSMPLHNALKYSFTPAHLSLYCWLINDSLLFGIQNSCPCCTYLGYLAIRTQTDNMFISLPSTSKGVFTCSVFQHIINNALFFCYHCIYEKCTEWVCNPLCVFYMDTVPTEKCLVNNLLITGLKNTTGKHPLMIMYDPSFKMENIWHRVSLHNLCLVFS